MALQEGEESRWDASQYKLDRFDAVAEPVQRQGVLENGIQFVSGWFSGTDKDMTYCQVDGCKDDVSKLRDYNCRYKICETHLKASSVVHQSIEQRFCQQCGKFHPIEAFDGSKRSCRARLDKHNARRRRQREMANMLRTTGRIDEGALCAKYGLTPAELAKKIGKDETQQHQAELQTEHQRRFILGNKWKFMLVLSSILGWNRMCDEFSGYYSS